MNAATSTSMLEGDDALEAILNEAAKSSPGVRRDAIPFDVYENPTGTPQRFDVVVTGPKLATSAEVGASSRLARVVVAPGATVRLPAFLQSAVHRIVCGHPTCVARKVGNHCVEDAHGGVILGGAAPLLKRRGCDASISDALIPAPEMPKRSIAPEDLAERLRAAKSGVVDPALERAARRRGTPS